MAQTKIEYVERPKTAWDGYCEFVGYLVIVAAIAAAILGIGGGLEYMFSDKTPPKQIVVEQHYYPSSAQVETCTNQGCTITGGTITVDPSGSGTVTSDAPGH